MPKPTRLVAYIRVSVVGEREQDGESFRSPELQRAAIDGIVATMPGAVVVDEVRDLNKSGGTMKRPGLSRALAAIEAGEADGIAVARLDRFARTTDGIEVIKEMTRAGKVFVSAADQFNTRTATGKMMLSIMITVAQFQRDQNVEATYVLNKGKIEEGVHVVVPYGYRRSDGKGSPLEPDPRTAPVVRRIFAAAVAGEPPSAIARALNDDGIPAKKGGRWGKQAVGAVLRTRSYLGIAKWGEHVHVDAHAALVSAEDFEAAQRPSGSIAPGRAVRGQGRHLLSGLVRCAGCGYLMGSANHGDGRMRWRCSGDHATGRCPAPTGAWMDALEAIVCDAFLARHASASVRGVDSAGEIAAAETAVARRRAELERWRDDGEMREALGEDDYRAGLLARKASLTSAEEKLEGLLRAADAAGLVVEGDLWLSLEMHERRELLRAAIDAVYVSSAASTRAPLAPRVALRFVGAEPDDAPVAVAVPV